MARKKKEDTVVPVDTVAWEKADALLNQLEAQQAQDVEPVDNKLRNQIVISLLDTAKVYMLIASEEDVLRNRVQSLIKIADIIVDELEKG